MERVRAHSNSPNLMALFIAGLAALALLVASSASVSAQSKGGQSDKPQPEQGISPEAAQVVHGFPLTITVEDNSRMDIRYRTPGEYEFYGTDAEGIYLWVNVGGTVYVYGPGAVPAGRSTNPYTPVSNAKTGTGSPSDPWKITTVMSVPSTNLRLTQVATYVNGAEFVRLDFQVAQIGGSVPVTATLFHAADLFTGGSDSGYGFYDSSTGGVGDYYTRTDSTVLYQQFVPNVPADAYEESYYGTIWGAIGDTSGPGGGFDNTVISTTQHDSGAGLQWNLTVPPNGSVTVGDTDLFSPHASLCGSFSDVPYGSFNYEFIYYLACHQIVSGYGDTTFRPGNPISRGQLAKMVSNSAGWGDPPSGQLFQDIAPGTTYYTYTYRIASRGYINGYPCGGLNEPCGGGNLPYFRPNDNASRGQIAKIVANAKGWTEVHTTQSYQDVGTNATFYQFVERLSSRGVVGGYPCGGAGEPCGGGNLPYFRPAANATRGQVSKIVANAFFPNCCSAQP